jgi:anthranilate synthase component 1
MNVLPKIKIGQKPIYKKIAEDTDIYYLFEQIEQEFTKCFLIESLCEEEKFARYSIRGFDPVPIISARDNVLKIDGDVYQVTNPYYKYFCKYI